MGLFSRFENKVENTVEGAAERFSSAPVSPAAIAKKCEKRMKSERMVGSGKQYAPTLYTVLVNPSDDRAMMGYYPTLSGELETLLTARAEESGLTMDGTPLVRFIADNSLRSGKFDVIAETVAAPIVEQLRDDELQRYGITRGRYEAELARKKARAREQAQAARREELQARGARRGSRDDAGEFEERPAVRGGGRVRQGSRRDMAPYAEEAPDAYAPEADAYGTPIRPMVYDSGYDRDSRFGSQPDENGKRRLPYVPEEAIDRSVDYGEYTFNSLNFEELDRRQGGEVPAVEPATPAEAPAAEAASGNRPAYPERPSRPFAERDVPEVLAPIEPAAVSATASAAFAASAAKPAYVAPAAPAASAKPASAAPAAASAKPAYVAPAAAPAVKPVATSSPAAAPSPAAVARATASTTAGAASSPAAAAPAAAASAKPAPASAAASMPNAAAAAAASAYRTPITFTPAAKIAPEARAMPARPVPGVLEREEQPGTPTISVPASTEPAEAAPKTLPYTDTPKPAPRYRIRNLQDGRSYTLTGTRVYIGRENTCNIVVADVNASRRHAELRNTGKGVWTLTDLGSTNGTFVNGKTASQAVLVNGDRITVGTTDLIFVVS